MSYNPLDPLGIGVSVGFSGLDASAPSNYTPSFSLKSDPSVRRKAVASIVQWLDTHRHSTPEKSIHTYDQVLTGVKLDHIDQVARNELYKDLKANPKIDAPDADHLQYRATHPGLYNIQDLEKYIAKFTYGLPADELADAYAGVKEDIEVGQQSNGIIVCICSAHPFLRHPLTVLNCCISIYVIVVFFLLFPFLISASSPLVSSTMFNISRRRSKFSSQSSPSLQCTSIKI